jgi:hypothetical protein
MRRMSSSKAGMGRTRGTERSSKPEELPEGPEFATRTRDVDLEAEGNGATATAESPTTRKGVFGAFDRRRASSGSPARMSSTEEADSAIAAEDTKAGLSPPPDENRGERRGSITQFLKKVF